MGMFKVGDKARLTKDNRGYGREGDEVIIIETHDGSAYCRFGYTIGDYTDWFVPLSSLVAIDSLRIEAGKYYKTRDGRKVGPMRGPEYSHYWGDDAMRCGDESYSMDGRCYDFGIANEDLIAEWQDEPTGSTAGFTVPVFDDDFDICGHRQPPVAEATSGKDDDEPDTKLIVSISADTSTLDAEIDRVLKRLRKLKRKARKLGISLEYSELRDAA